MKNNTVDYYQKLKNDFLVEDQDLFRFGSIEDGGYFLKPKTLKNAEVLFSGGISSNLEFEYDAFRFNPNIKIVMVDPTISGSKLLIKGFARLFFKKRDKIRYIFNALLFNYLVRTERCTHLKLWLNKEQSIFSLLKTNFKIEKNILLKLDIEGGEYDLIDEIVNNQKAFKAMVFEFHDLDEKHELVLNFLKDCSSNFKMVHLNINPAGGFLNGQPKCIEISLERL
ncbi:FkbM family methyltransferase [Lacinutrix mariniflava]|uniref:FkbM family methyltransferase n=1 Tax=Lacinutrix mariniflava TaxID=342955 RepID=UPI0006E2711C|nr:FkbM family methyltransferase [Lacinutrix mariniflava]